MYFCLFCRVVCVPFSYVLHVFCSLPNKRISHDWTWEWNETSWSCRVTVLCRAIRVNQVLISQEDSQSWLILTYVWSHQPHFWSIVAQKLATSTKICSVYTWCLPDTLPHFKMAYSSWCSIVRSAVSPARSPSPATARLSSEQARGLSQHHKSVVRLSSEGTASTICSAPSQAPSRSSAVLLAQIQKNPSSGFVGGLLRAAFPAVLLQNVCAAVWVIFSHLCCLSCQWWRNRISAL